MRRPPALAAGAALALTLIVAPAAAGPVTSLAEMRRQHVVLQEWDVSCGAAALATLLRYGYGVAVTERDVALGLVARAEYLDDPSRVRARHGFSLLDMKRYAAALGFEGVGYGELTLARLVDLAPAIVPVDLAGYPHFVVFRGTADGRVLLADPAWGNRTLTVARFEAAWLGFPGLGRVGFVVRPPAGVRAEGGLAPRPADFVTLR